MLELQENGAHNINLVTPTHYSIQLAEILHKIKGRELQIPVVWNSSAYENVETLRLLDGLIDVYLPDLKYADRKNSALFSNAVDYPEIARKAILEMYRQTGKLKLDEVGLAEKGLIIRLLVLPNDVAGVSESLHWINDFMSNGVYISLMAQYYPAWKSDMYKEINRGITQPEYEVILDTLHNIGFYNGFTQELSCSAHWTPDFHSTEKF